MLELSGLVSPPLLREEISHLPAPRQLLVLRLGPQRDSGSRLESAGPTTQSPAAQGTQLQQRAWPALGNMRNRYFIVYVTEIWWLIVTQQ